MNRKGFAPVIILLIVVGILVIAAGIYYAGQNKPKISMVTTSPKSASSTVAISTSSAKIPWNAYANAKYNYSIQYPSDSQYSVFGTSPEDPRGVLFTVGTTTVRDISVDGGSILFLQLIASRSTSTLDQWVNRETQASGPTDIGLISKKPFVIGGGPAYWTEFTGGGLNTGSYDMVLIFFVHDGIEYRIGGARVPDGNRVSFLMQREPSTTLAILHYEPIFDQMVQSFSFLDESSSSNQP